MTTAHAPPYTVVRGSKFLPFLGESQVNTEITAVMKTSRMAATVPALTALMASIRGAGQTLPEASRILYDARRKRVRKKP
ncbi:hypothetical protein F383_33064 [Gossypium arboreum]|uniref:Uncharacterized protein n=1 Tax=Gossypium arboreum TaxID=29729 RepID=A0A0B0PPP0_GOSAR|nr:hypothetical protein F383_33064 [Gossypium arboreum]